MALSPEVLKAVLSEVGENVAVLETELVEAAMPIADAPVLDNLSRAAHTQKGRAGAAELQELHRIAAAIELVLAQARSGSLVIDGFVGGLLREASGACARLAGGEGPEALDVGPLVKRLEAVEASSAPTRRVLFHTPSALSAPAPGPDGSPRPIDRPTDS